MVITRLPFSSSTRKLRKTVSMPSACTSTNGPQLTKHPFWPTRKQTITLNIRGCPDPIREILIQFIVFCQLHSQSGNPRRGWFLARYAPLVLSWTSCIGAKWCCHLPSWVTVGCKKCLDVAWDIGHLATGCCSPSLFKEEDLHHYPQRESLVLSCVRAGFHRQLFAV